jgi:3-oxoacyl-[acyl-carrier-protein] synthase II
MARNDRRVLITGLAVISPVGIGAEAFRGSLAERRGGIGPIRSFPVAGLPSAAGGEILNFRARDHAAPKHAKALQKSLKYMARDIQLAVAGAELAMADAGLIDGGVDPTRIGLDLGAGLIATDLDELAPAMQKAFPNGGALDYKAYAREGIPLIPPIWLLKYLPNMLACHISILMDCQGPSNSITENEAASNLAIGEATRIIQRGRADVMIAGGADTKIHPMSLVRIGLAEQMSTWPGDPSAACRPFDKDRAGIVPGEGAGILILEEAEHAARRGAKVYGEILGAGSGCDAYPSGGQDPEGKGTEVAIRAALRDAGLKPSEIGHINAHGSATRISDLAEARAFRRIFGDGPSVPVTALKGYMGNLVSGCGVVEAIGSLLGVNAGWIPSVLHCDEQDPECGLDLVLGNSRPTDNPIFVNTNLTRNGQAAALVIRGQRTSG